MDEPTGGGAPPRPVRSIALISNTAHSLVNFRGPLIEAMAARGVRVHALAPDYEERSRKAVRDLGAEPVDIRMDRTGMNLFRDIAGAVSLARLLRRLRPDLTFGYFIKPIIFGSLAARAAGVPRRFALVAGLGYVFTPGPRREGLRRRLLRRTVSTLYGLAFRSCERVFFQNGEDIAEFVAAGLLPAAKAVRLNGTGVDLERFGLAPPVAEPVRFLLMARLLREKGIVEFVEAARLVRRAWPSAEFTLLGGFDSNPGGLRREEITAWTEQGDIRWIDHVDDVRPWIARSSVYVLPSYYREGVPRSTQEAMAMGRPIITADSVGCRETVIEGYNGHLVPVRDAAAVAAAMTRFLENPGLIATMGAASRALAEERFDVHRVNAQILGVMGIAGPAPPS